MTATRSTVTFGDLARAAYCPRQLYYDRRSDDRAPPPEALERRDLAFRYPTLREADDATLLALPIAVEPDEYRSALARLSERDDWERLADPDSRTRRLAGRDCHGVVHKVLGGDPPVPSIVSPGVPPETGVWEPQSVRAVAAAKALTWERGEEIPRALLEYPAVGAVREVPLTTRRKATYRRVLRTVRTLDGPPSRLRNDARCSACDYRDRCGVKTRSLRSLLGL